MAKTDYADGTQRKRGSVLIGIGFVLLAAALALAGYGLWDSHRAGQEAAAIVSQLPQGSTDTAVQWTADAEMPTMTVDGYECIGTVEIPSLDLRLPVLSNWDNDLLRVSPCRYAGSYWADDMVVCGSNYSTHFGPITGCEPGMDVYFTNVDGLQIHYRVSNVETVSASDVEKMTANDKNSSSTSDWDLTLFTRTFGGSERCAVRCIRVSGPGV